jgi:hypothetical protein
VASWINYYGRFRPWELIPFLMRINAYLVRWIRKKYQRLAAKRKALAKLQEIAQRYPPHVRALAPHSADQRRTDLKNRATRAV